LVVATLILTPSTIVDAVESTTGSPEAELPVETEIGESGETTPIESPTSTPTETPVEETSTPESGSGDGSAEPTATVVPDESQPEADPTEPANGGDDASPTEIPATPTSDETDVDLTPETDPTTATPTASPQPTREIEDVNVEAISIGTSAIPGGTIDQLFRITNPNQSDVTVRLEVSTSAPGWEATVLDATVTFTIDDLITIAAADHLDVIVRVTIPPEAYAGDRSTTSLHAIPVESA
jgi:hypothetical protein